MQESPMETGTIEQIVHFNASPTAVYQLIMDAAKHSGFSEAEVNMSNEINGKFDTYDGYCHGYNIELIPGKKIVQAWHFQEEGWPEDHFSICTFLFEENENDQTTLTFSQTQIPTHKIAALETGWQDFYWKPMKEYISK